MIRKTIKGGDQVLHCCHVHPSAGIHRHLIIEKANRDWMNFNIPRDFALADIDWMMLCIHCRRSGDAVEGAPYKRFQAQRDIPIDLTYAPGGLGRG